MHITLNHGFCNVKNLILEDISEVTITALQVNTKIREFTHGTF